MDDSRLDALVRSLAADHSRRGLTHLCGGLALGGPLALLGLSETAAKRKKYKRKRRKEKEPTAGGTPVPPPPPPTCAESCSAPCNNCFHRPVGPPLCGDSGQGFCSRPCLSDNDCLGTDSPYCIIGHTDRLTNAFDQPNCVNGNRTICYTLGACG
jgi:hypothetical protein